jgi:hypothetical protein
MVMRAQLCVPNFWVVGGAQAVVWMSASVTNRPGILFFFFEKEDKPKAWIGDSA